MTTTPQTNATLEEIAHVIREYDNFVICGHVSPDGDCVGSELALYHALRYLGKNATCLIARDEPLDAGFAFMDGIADMVPASSYDGPCDVFVGVDVPTRERIADAVRFLDASTTSITIDHHACDTTMCEHVYVDPDAASASCIVWEVVKLLIEEPPVECAIATYVGLATDTGSFQFQNSDARAFEVASELIAQGVNPAEVAQHVFLNRSLASLKLEALTITRLELFADDEAALSWMRQEDVDAVSATKPDLEPLIDAVRSVQGIRVACMLREQDGKVRGSLRSKDGTDVRAIALEYGGGGHRAAAGFTLDVPLEEAVEMLKARIASILA